MVAAQANSLEVAKLLIEYDADVGHKDEWGNNPMGCAIENDSIDVTKLLINQGVIYAR